MIVKETTTPADRTFTLAVNKRELDTIGAALSYILSDLSIRGAGLSLTPTTTYRGIEQGEFRALRDAIKV